MSSNSSKTPFDFVFDVARITADRAPGQSMNIGQAIYELNVFEHIEKPYVTGNVVIVDTVDLYQFGDFQGTERFELQVSFPDDATKVFNKKFVITSVAKSRKGNDNVEVFVLTLVEESFFLSKIEVISKSYDGKPSEIIETVIENADLGISVDINDTEIQAPMRYLVPYITPFDVCERIKNVATTAEGYPYFLYSSMGTGDKIVWKSLTSMFKDAGVVNKYEPFTYSIYMTGKSDAQIAKSIGVDVNDPRNDATAASRLESTTLEERSKIIENYSIGRNNDLLSLIERGRVGSNVQHMNVTSFAYVDFQFDVDKVFDDMENDLFDRDQKKRSYDNKAFDGLHTKIGNKVTHIFASDIYTDPMFNIRDIGSEAVGDNVRNTHSQMAIRSFFEKEAVNVQLPGYSFWPNGSTNKNRTIGRKIPLQFLGSSTEQETKVDKRRSGEYIIYAARHRFSISRYDITLTGVKLSSGKFE
jgi:hypothetical protein